MSIPILRLKDENGVWQSVPAIKGETPVKGVDYFTDADVAEVVADVKSELATVASTGEYKDLKNKCASSENVKAVAHRGYSIASGAPENTIPAYRLAKEMGFDYAECDVAFTADNVAVLLHDDTVDRTSNGTGRISELTLAEVKALDFGSWHASGKYAGTTIPTFAEFMATCKAIGMKPYVELKSSGGYTQEQIESVVDIVRATGMIKNTTFISYNYIYLGYVRDYSPKSRLGYLCGSTYSTSLVQTAASLKNDYNEVFLSASRDMAITDEIVTQLVENDIGLEVWTVNSFSVLQTLNAYITGITTDYINIAEFIAKPTVALVVSNLIKGPVPLVDYDLTSYSGDGTLVNIGSGGATYNATVANSSGTITAQDDGLHITNGAYSRTPYAIGADTVGTVVMAFSDLVESDKTYQRIVRAESDSPSVYHALNLATPVKLTGVETDSTVIVDTGNCYNANKSVTLTSLRAEQLVGNNVIAFVMDGTNIALYWNGNKMAYEAQSNFASTSSYIGFGDNSGGSNYAASMTIKGFQIYDKALTDAEIATLSATYLN